MDPSVVVMALLTVGNYMAPKTNDSFHIRVLHSIDSPNLVIEFLLDIVYIIVPLYPTLCYVLCPSHYRIIKAYCEVVSNTKVYR